MIEKEVFVSRTRDFLHEIARLNKKAAKIGVSPIQFTDLGQVSKTRSVVSVDEDGKEDVRTYPVDVQHYRLTLPDVADCQWSPIVKITPVEGGDAFAEAMPAGTAADAEQWKGADPVNCDHCHTKRARAISYVVRHNTDGRVLQLGRNCFQDYVGKDTLAALEFQAVIMANLGGDEDGFWGEGGAMRQIPIVKLAECVAVAEMLYRTEGWQNNVRNDYGDLEVEGTHRIAGRMVREPRSEPLRNELALRTQQLNAARHGLKEQAVWEAAGNVLADPVSLRITEGWKSTVETMPAQIEALQAQIAKLEPTDADRDAAAAIIARMQDVEVSDEFGQTLQNIADYEWIPARKASLACYTGQFLRNIDRKANEARVNLSRVYRGTVGQREAFSDLTVTRVHSNETQFGWNNINIFEDADHNVLVWKTTALYQVGDKVNLMGTVKEHSEYRDTKQTILSRCKELDAAALAKELAKAARKAAKIERLSTAAV